MATSRILFFLFITLFYISDYSYASLRSTQVVTKILRPNLIVPTLVHSQRLDLRADPFMTIDPETAQELDDALYVETQNGKMRCKVAIADPVPVILDQDPGLLLKALEQGYTRYDFNPVAPLYPEVITSKTSLLPGKDCPSVVVDFTINNKGKIQGGAQIYQAVIHSRAKLSYAEVNSHVNQGHGLKDSCVPHVQSILLAAGLLRADRLKTAPSTMSGEAAVAEMMMQANFIVAKFMHKTTLSGPYRVQESTNEKAFYSSKPRRHASMQNQVYTHFTSPLRRFADCMVHAALFYPGAWAHLYDGIDFNGTFVQMNESMCDTLNATEEGIKQAKKKKKRKVANDNLPQDAGYPSVVQRKN